MKKILLFLSFLLMSIGVFGTTATLTLSSSKKFGTTSGSTLSDTQGNTWTCTGNSIQNSYNTTYNGQLFGTASTDNIYTFTCSISGATITNISATMAAGNTTPTYDISVGSISKKSGSLSKTSTTYSTGTISASGEICITIDLNGAGKAAYLGFISVTYTISGYTVTYDSNGGSGDLNDPSSPYTSGSTVAVLTNNGSVSKNGYTFDSWNTKSNGSGIEYLGEETFIITLNTTLYAKWLKDTTITKECNIFHETWDETDGTGGNDGSMSGTVGTKEIKSDNVGWIITKPDSLYNMNWGADKCIRIGIGKVGGYALSPVIQKGNQNEACLTFRAAGWGTDGTVLSLSVDNATLDVSTISLTNSTWKTYTVYLTNITDDYVITWANLGGNKRFFLDDICITEVSNQLDIISWYNDSIIISKNYFDSIPFEADNIRIDGLLTKTTLTENVNGEFKISVDLHESYCTDKKFIVSDGTHALSQTVRIPRIITTPTNTNTISNADCDVVVQSILTVSGTTSVNRDVKLYKGAHLSIPSGTTYTINSLVLRRDNLTPSTIHLNGTLNNINKLYFDLYVDASDWYFVCLPNTFTLTDLKYTNGRIPKYQSDYWIRLYDGEHRAAYQNNSWTDAELNKEFAVGEGFIFGLNDDLKKKEFRFEIPISTLDSETDDKNVGNLHAWGGNTNIRPNHKGWNLIGNPFMNSVVTDLASPIRIDSLVKVMNGGQWTGQWDLSNSDRGKKFRYGVFPSRDKEDAPAGYYKSVVLDDITLNPFTSFFVQIGGDDPSTNEAIVFNKDNRGPLHITKKIDDEDEELFLRIKVGDRKTGMFISNKFTDEYEPGDDLESRYPIYQSIGGYKLLYSAINDSIIEHGVQVTAPQGTLYLDPKVDINKFEYISALYNNDWYDLKNGLEVEVNGTFIIQAKRKTKESTTSVENINLNLVIKYILDGNLYIKMNNKIYNILGDRIQ